MWVAAYHEIQTTHLGGEVIKETVKEKVLQHPTGSHAETGNNSKWLPEVPEIEQFL